MEGLYESSYISVHIYIFFIYGLWLLFRLCSRINLYEEIQKHVKQYEITPQNAMIDKIWKAMPGYNGKKWILKRPIKI